MLIEPSRRHILAMLTALVGIPRGGWWLFRRRNILEHTRRAKFYDRKPVVNAQGIRLWLTLVVLIMILGWQYLDQGYIWIYLIAITILGFTSTIDLFHPLPSRVRLLIQLGVFA